MKKFYTTILAAIFTVALFGQVDLQNNSSVNNDNSSLNIITQKKNISAIDAELEKIKVYPNPVNDELMIDLNKTNLTIPKIELFDITGRLVRSIEVKEKEILKVDFSDQRKGLYLLSFYNKIGEVIQISKVQKI